MNAAPALSLSLLLAAASPSAAEGRSCFSAEQTRSQIAAHKLVEPFKLMKEAGSETKGEPIGVKLCRWNENLVYEISVLRRDGRVLHVFMDAATGQRMAARKER